MAEVQVHGARPCEVTVGGMNYAASYEVSQVWWTGLYEWRVEVHNELMHLWREQVDVTIRDGSKEMRGQALVVEVKVEEARAGQAVKWRSILVGNGPLDPEPEGWAAADSLPPWQINKDAFCYPFPAEPEPLAEPNFWDPVTDDPAPVVRVMSAGTPRPWLTDDEHRAVHLAGELWTLLCGIIGDRRTREADLRELVVHVHALQNAVMAQAAARAYPDRYRLLGESLKPPTAEGGEG